MTFVFFDDEFRALNLCVIMGKLNFMKLMCLCVQAHGCCL